jgi:hypothetical protein
MNLYMYACAFVVLLAGFAEGTFDNGSFDWTQCTSEAPLDLVDLHVKCHVLETLRSVCLRLSVSVVRGVLLHRSQYRLPGLLNLIKLAYM